MSTHISLRGVESNEIALGVVQDVSGAGVVCRLDVSAHLGFTGGGEPAPRILGSIGSHVKLCVGSLMLIAEIRELKLLPDAGNTSILALAEFLGEGHATSHGQLANFRRGISCYPLPGDSIYAVSHEDLKQIFGAENRSLIEIGAVQPVGTIGAGLNMDALLGKHFAIVGSSGTGKSTLVALLLQEIAKKAPEGHILIIDPHGEYGRSFPTVGKTFDVDNLSLPYWLMNLDEHCEFFGGSDSEIDRDILAKCVLQARARNPAAASIRNLNVNTPVPYMLSDLISALDQQMGRIEKLGESRHYLRLGLKIKQMAADRRFRFIFDESLFFISLSDLLSNILRLPADGKPISVIELSRAPSEILNVVVAVLARLVFNYAIWSHQTSTTPIVFVCEEAHNYLPSNKKDGNVAAASAILARIAKEGRKYGVSLGLVTQRPSDLHEAVLSQCGTFIAMRLNNGKDQACLRNALSETGSHFMEMIQSLRNRECIICGEGVSAPVRVLVRDLEPELRPNSEDPVFSEVWKKSRNEKEIVEKTIDHWINRVI
jgi:uncharacterized protein